MLAKKCSTAVLSVLQKQKTITVLELAQALSISESTIRRNLVALHKIGKLKKVHGGAALLHKEYGLYEVEVAVCSEGHVEEKKRIARYAASLIQARDFIYIDTGSTALHMVEYLKEKEAIYVTNELEYRRRLAAQSFHTSLLAGELKGEAEAMVSLDAVPSLQKYSFNKAFFGTNGITVDSGFATPGTNEVYVKVETMKRAQKCHVLADSGKFGTCTSIMAADISDATITTGKGVEKEYLEGTGMIEVEE